MLYVVLACGWHEEVSVAGDIGVWKKGVKGSRNETLEVSTINQPPKLDGQSTFQPLGDFIRIYIYITILKYIEFWYNSIPRH